MVLEKEDKEMAHKRKTVTDLEQRVGERKKKYVLNILLRRSRQSGVARATIPD